MRWLLTILICLACASSHAQELTGRIIAAKTYTPVADVLVANKRTGVTTYSDSSGRYKITSSEGDLLFFYRLGYFSTREPVRIKNGENVTIVLEASDIFLDEVRIKANTYQMDSLERAIIYHKPLKDASETVKMHVGTGIAFEGLIGKLAGKLTGREKRVKNFQRRFNQGEQDKFIATKYTLALVAKTTGLTGDAAGIFIDHFPMPYEFARTASDLELQMWVRNNYNQYTNSAKEKQ